MDSLLSGMMKPDAYPHSVASFELLETHISWVILTGDYAYKLKKPIHFDFIDCSTLERRRRFCEEEIRLNRRLTNDIYLEVCGIYGSHENPTLIEHGTPIEFAVKMRQFDQSCLLPSVLKRGELRVEHVDRLARRIAEFHSRAVVACSDSEFGAPSVVRSQAMENFDSLTHCAEFGEQVHALESWTQSEYVRRVGWFRQRRDNGWIRECHGDMHLGNMVLLHDNVEVFDCIEFNDRLRWIDVISEVAFLVMDLHERGRRDLAFRFLNRWLEDTGDYVSLAGLRWYIVYRAVVRAKVAALRRGQAELSEVDDQQSRTDVRKYVSLALEWSKPSSPCILVMHGLSGSGKSHVAQWLCEHFGMILLRSDVERKRMFGIWGSASDQRCGEEIYTADATAILYRDILANRVLQTIGGGLSIVVDAAHLLHWQRQIFLDLASAANLPCAIIHVDAPIDTLRRRIEARQAASIDPSDATIAVMERQAAIREPLTGDEQERSIAVDSDQGDWQSGLAEAVRRVLTGISR